MRRSDDEDSDLPQDAEPLRDLMCGIGPRHVRQLCENPWDGGRGYTPAQVGAMTLDELFLLLCDKKLLRAGQNQRTVSMGSLEAISMSPDGMIKGRTADGQPIEGKVTGKSVARQLMEAEEAAKIAENAKKPRRSRRRR